MTVEPLNDAQLAALVQTMPASPRLLAELTPMLQQAEVPLGDVTALLRRDPALTARLIAMANSAAYARAEPATSLEDAVACVGYREVYRLIGAIAASRMADGALTVYGIEALRFRENALFVALVMEELAESAGADARAAYTMGLLRSIGKVALDRHSRACEPATRLDERSSTLLDWERSQWGTTSAEVGARILAQWRFPSDTIEAVRDHYAPSARSVDMAHLLNVAAGAADLRGFALPGEETYWHFTPESFARTGVDEGKLVWVGERAFQTLRRIDAALH